MTTPLAAPAASAAPARNTLLLAADAASALFALLAFVFGFLTFYGADASDITDEVAVKGYSLFAVPEVLGLMLVGGLAAAQLGRAGGYRLQVAVAAGVLTLYELGRVFSGVDKGLFGSQEDLFSRKVGFWLLLVAVILQLLVAVAAVLVDNGVISAPQRKPADPAQSYGAGGFGGQGQYGQPAQGGYGQGQYGQPSPGYAPPAAAPSPGYGQPSGQPGYGGQPSYGQPAGGQPSAPPPSQQPSPQPPAQPGYGSSGSGYGQQPGQQSPPPQPNQGAAPVSQPWQAPNS